MARFRIRDGKLTQLQEKIASGSHGRRPLTVADFREIAAEVGTTPRVYAKSGASFVVLQVVQEPTTLTTVNADGSTSSHGTLRPGDAIATRLDRATLAVKRGADGSPDQYAIKAGDVGRLFEATDRVVEGLGPVYAGKNVVEAIPFANGVEIEAPWGGTQRTPDGYLLHSQVTDEVYGCDEAGFEAYRTVGAETSITRP